MYGFNIELEDGGESDLHANDSFQFLDDDNKKLLDAAVKVNNLLLANLKMAFTKKVSMYLVNRSKIEDWTRGLAHKVVSALKEKHQQKDTIYRVEVIGNLNDVIMKDSDDPQETFNQLTAIKDKYNDNDAGIKVDKSDLISVALSVAPEKYQGVMAEEQIQKAGAITLENLCTCSAPPRANIPQKRIVVEKWLFLVSRENTTTVKNLGIVSSSAPTKDVRTMPDSVEMETAMVAESATDSMNTVTTVVRNSTSRMISGRMNKTITIAPRSGNIQVSKRLQPLMEVVALKLFSWQHMV